MFPGSREETPPLRPFGCALDSHTIPTVSTVSRRVIGPLGGFAIVAGSMLGIGIFLSPPIVAKYVAEPLPFLLVWVAGGLTALAGAVACGEVGAMFPRAGGDYVFQYEAYGQSVAFASGWTLPSLSLALR